MIKVKIEWTSTRFQRFNNDIDEDEQKRMKGFEGIKEFNNEKEMLDYAFKTYDGEIVVSKDKELMDPDIDYEIELYNYYRE